MIIKLCLMAYTVRKGTNPARYRAGALQNQEHSSGHSARAEIVQWVTLKKKKTNIAKLFG